MPQFSVEPWAQAVPELKELFPLLWEEVALHKDKMVAKCDEGQYAALDKIGCLHLVTARDKGKIVGYVLFLTVPAGHYEGAGLFALSDMYFTRPEYRKGGFGAKLLAFADFTVKQKVINGRKVVRILISHKVAHDRSGIFKALGYEPCDVMYSKYVGDK